MSRNTEYQFLPTDPEEITAELVRAYEEITGETVRPAHPKRLFIQWVASIIRPLAKLSRTIKIADTSNQGEAESEAISAIAITL